MDDITSLFIDRFSAKRKEKSLTLADIATLIGVSEQMTKRIFNKQSNITTDKLWTLVRYFAMEEEVPYILRGEDPSNVLVDLGNEGALHQKLNLIIKNQEESENNFREIKVFFDKLKEVSKKEKPDLLKPGEEQDHNGEE